MKKHICLCLLLLSACSTPSHSILPSPGPSVVPTPSRPPATEDISSSGGDGNMGNPDVLATPTPLPSSQVPPEQVGPTAIPSGFSPQCPAGETYTLPLPIPQATAPQYPFPTPLPPYLMKYTFALPLEVSQSSFCGTGTPRHWFIDSAQVLSYQEGNQAPQRIQLNATQTQEMIQLLNTAQPQQWAYAPEPVYRCQAAEICPLEQHISVGTDNGGQTSWSDRGNLAYPEAYTQTITQLIEKIESARQSSPNASSAQTYQSALAFRRFNAAEQITGTSYVLLPEGTLRAYQDNVEVKEIRLSPEQQANFQERLQSLAPMEAYARLVSDVNTPQNLANETFWQFEYVRTGPIYGSYGGSIALSTLPDTPEATTLKTNLDKLVNQLKAYFDENTP